MQNTGKTDLLTIVTIGIVLCLAMVVYDNLQDDTPDSEWMFCSEIPDGVCYEDDGHAPGMCRIVPCDIPERITCNEDLDCEGWRALSGEYYCHSMDGEGGWPYGSVVAEGGPGFCMQEDSIPEFKDYTGFCVCGVDW